jgi:hypothetical protein
VKFKSGREGSIVVTFDVAEMELLRAVPEQLRLLYAADESDPARARLFPRAYLDPTEEGAEDEWVELVHPDLLRQRLEGLDELLRTLDGAEVKGRRSVVTLSPDEVAMWLAVVNDARLAFGTRLEITDDTDVYRVRPDDPLGPERAAYGWLTTLQGVLVEAMLDGMPD